MTPTLVRRSAVVDGVDAQPPTQVLVAPRREAKEAQRLARLPMYGEDGWDSIVLARLCAGDEHALVEVHRVLLGFVRTTVERITRAPSMTDDVVQEVFLSLWTQPDRVDTTRGSIRTFVGVLARRRSIDWIRSEERRRHRQEVAGATSIVEDIDLLADLLRAEERGVLHGALSRLPAEQRIAVELAYFESHTFRDVAVALGIPEGTAKSRLRLALGHLRNDLTTTQQEATTQQVAATQQEAPMDDSRPNRGLASTPNSPRMKAKP